MDRSRALLLARTLAFALLVLLALWLGRSTRPEGSQIALAWPAAGVVVWWLASTRSRGEGAFAAGVVGVAATALNILTGAPPWAALGFGLTNAAHAVVGVVVLRRLLTGAPGLRAPADVVRVLVAAVAAAAVSASAAAGVTAAGLEEGVWTTLGLVFVRNAGSTFVLLAAVLALREGRRPLHGRRAELLAAAFLSAALVVGVFYLVEPGVPLLFLVMLVPVWFGTRLGPSATAVSGALLSVFAVSATLLGWGPVALADVHVRALVVQAFIVVLTLVGLLLATLQEVGDELRARLDDNRRELQEAADAAVIGKAVVVRGADGGWTLTRPNPALVRLLGRDPSAMRWRELLFPNDAVVVRAALDRIADGLDDAWEGEVRHCLPGGGAVWTQLHVSGMPSQSGATAVVAQLLDTTERRAAQEELSRLALHDSLTGLPNRARLHARLDEMLVDATPGSRVVVVFVDLDGFKLVNDGYGHETGDAVLQAVADALRAALRPEDVVGRLGGDEFVACCPGLPDPAGAAVLVRRVVATLSPALLVRGRDVGLGVSAGWTMSAPGDDSTTLLRRSDEAMYTAKREGKGRVAVDPTVVAPAALAPAPLDPAPLDPAALDPARAVPAQR